MIGKYFLNFFQEFWRFEHDSERIRTEMSAEAVMLVNDAN